MVNQVILVGRTISKPIILKKEDGNQHIIVEISIPRSYKNENGEYENDIVKIYLPNFIGEQAIECCDAGDVIGIKGRIQTINNEQRIIAEKLTFLSSTKDKNEEEN